MNPGGIVEETGETARSLIDSFKAQPAILALIVANIAMLIFMFYALYKAAEFRDNMLKAQFDYQHKVSDLLARCVVPTTKSSDDDTGAGPVIPLNQSEHQ